MKHLLRQTLAISLGIAALNVSAATPSSRQEVLDSLISDHHIIMMGGGETEKPGNDSIRSLIENFYIDQFRNYQDPAAPYFMFMSHDANMAMGVGGVVRMRMYFDPGNSMPGAAFTPW